MSKDMVTIQIEAGCPSGGFRYQSFTVTVHKKLVKDFIGNLMEYARQEAQAPHWQYNWHFSEEEE
tara:strand:- start:534 stop:728 length:195 start_codon:yes stop_codon:yes gene_type:complete